MYVFCIQSLQNLELKLKGHSYLVIWVEHEESLLAEMQSIFVEMTLSNVKTGIG